MAYRSSQRLNSMKDPSPIPQAVLSGETADVYFLRTQTIREREQKNPVATMEVFPGRQGVLCGMNEALHLLRSVLPRAAEVWALDEGLRMSAKEVVLRITAPYRSYGLYETAVLGTLAHCSGWGNAARGSGEVAPRIAGIEFCAA